MLEISLHSQLIFSWSFLNLSSLISLIFFSGRSTSRFQSNDWRLPPRQIVLSQFYAAFKEPQSILPKSRPVGRSHRWWRKTVWILSQLHCRCKRRNYFFKEASGAKVFHSRGFLSRTNENYLQVNKLKLLFMVLILKIEPERKSCHWWKTFSKALLKFMSYTLVRIVPRFSPPKSKGSCKIQPILNKW